MLLTDDKSKCGEYQKIIVSRDTGNKREHRAINSNGKHKVRQYKLDGDIVKQRKSCDFLVLNDSVKKAYYIELKGENIDEAIPQLESAVQICSQELRQYDVFYRIVCSKIRTHKINSNKFRKFQAKVGRKLQYSSVRMEENI